MRPFISIFILLSYFCDAQLIENIDINSSTLNDWYFRKKGDSEWKRAEVPGCVYTDLLRKKLIADPFIGENESKVQWVENENWEYKTEFTIDEKKIKEFNRCELTLNRIDTYCKIYLNDSLIFNCDSQFREWKKEIKKYLRVGKNKLLFEFESSINKAKGLGAKLSYKLPGDEKVFNRSAQFNYGWDFAPRFVGCGILQPVKLLFWKEIKINDFYSEQTFVSKDSANLIAHANVEANISTTYTFQIQTNNQNNRVYVSKPIKLNKGINNLDFKITIEKPELWWCNGYGNPRLYIFELSVASKIGKISSIKNIGIRKIELVQEKDSIGKSFYFKLNGVPVFAKGANFIPPDNFLTRTRDYTFPLTAKQLNMNMLRVWGGGTYASDDFYSQCDENGILVWQDFMFACAMYPGDSSFTNNVKQEIKEQILRLRNHPCMALWCGNNEIDEGWHNWEWQKEFKYSKTDSAKIWNDYKNLFENIIPKIVKENNSQCFYWPSSPSIGWGHKESLLQGDSHYWGIWWGKEQFENYEKKVGRFMSEYGFQSLPVYSSFQNFCSEAELNLTSSTIKYHQKNKDGFENIKTYMERDYKIPEKFENYIYVSQLLQANGMKTAIEAHRIAKPNCMGSLFWQMNDCWPAVSWSAIDYYGEPKAFYYYAKNLFNTLLISIHNKNNSLDVFVISDSINNVNGKLSLQLLNFNSSASLTSNLIWKKTISCSVTNSNNFKYSVLKKELPPFDTVSSYLNLKFIVNGEVLANSNFLFAKPKNLLLPKVNLIVKKINNDTFEVSSDLFAKDVYLYSEKGGIILSQNFFDLKAGETKTITIVKRNSLTNNPELRAIVLNNL